MAEELRKELFYETHKHRLGPREFKDFFKFLETDPRFDESLRHFIGSWEILIELIPSMPENGQFEFPGIMCIHRDEPVVFRDDGLMSRSCGFIKGRTNRLVSNP